MKKLVGMLSLPLILMLGAGCAHNHKVDGPQEKSEIPAGVRVSIGGKEVKEGDTLHVYKSECHSVDSNKGMRKSCSDKEIGKAVVLKVLDHDSAIVEPQGGLAMDSSMKVEKKKEK